MTAPVNLCLVVHRVWEDWRDFYEIAQLVIQEDPGISVHIVSPGDTADAIPVHAQDRPTLTLALRDSGSFKPKRGPMLVNRRIDKLDQYRRFLATGLPTPRTEIFQFGKLYSEAAWSTYLFLKPATTRHSSSGGGKIARTSTAHLLKLTDFAEDGRKPPPMIVQPFIDTGAKPSKYRVLVLAGSALYAQYTEVIAERPDLSSLSDSELLELVLDTGGADRVYRHEHYPDVVALAERTARAFNKLPLLGIDIVESRPDRGLYVLEINGGGNVWHFSSNHWEKARKKYPHAVDEMKSQFGAWSRAAAALARWTRTLAR